jgi:alkylhydroperoxidase/carboxymuconolactone decarboxylase family protein YurZ
MQRPADGRDALTERLAHQPIGQTVRFQETLRRLAMIDEGFVEDEAGLELDPAQASALDPKTAALLHVAVCVAIGAPGVCLECSTGRALGAGTSEDEIAGVLPAVRTRDIAPAGRDRTGLETADRDRPWPGRHPGAGTGGRMLPLQLFYPFDHRLYSSEFGEGAAPDPGSGLSY